MDKEETKVTKKNVIKATIEDYKVLLRNVPALVTVIFCIGTYVMNAAAAKLVLDLDVVACTGGIFLSWLPFLCMDTVSKHFGARASILLNILSSVFNILITIFLAIVAAIPTEQDYSAFNSTYSAVWFIVLSSNVAFILSGVVNSLLNVSIGKLFKNKTSGKEFFTRSAISTFIGQIVDNFVFMWLLYGVFAPIYWGMEPMSVWTCLGTGVLGGLLELVCELILTPVGYKIVRNWERDGVGKEYIELHSSNRS